MIVVFIDDVYDNHFRRTWTLPTQFRHGHGGGRQARKVDVDGDGDEWEMEDAPADAEASHFSS